MKNKIIYILFVFFTAGFTFISCTDYLDRDSDSVLSEEDAFKNFNNFQGFVEVMYNVIPDVAKHNWVSSFNWGDDEVITTGNGEYLMGYAIDGGNYRSYINKGDCFWIVRGLWISALVQEVHVSIKLCGVEAGMPSVKPISDLKLWKRSVERCYTGRAKLY